MSAPVVRWAGPLGLLAGVCLGLPTGAALGAAGGPVPLAALQADPGAPADTAGVDPGEIPELLASEEDRGEAFAAIHARILELAGTRATLWTQLLAVARATDPAAGALAASAVLRADDGDAPGGVRLLEEGLDEAGEASRPALLALAAHLADAGDPEHAAALRERLLELDPGAPEAPEAALRLARYRAGPGDDREGAVRLLEELVVANPDHPVAPAARRALRELGGGPR